MSKEKQKKSLLNLITAENLQEVNSDKKGLEELTKRFNEVTEFLFATDEVQKVLKEKDQKIFDLEAKLALTEKALELACERVKYFEEMQDNEMGFYEFFGYDSDYDLQAIIEQYKEQAKEMMKSE